MMLEMLVLVDQMDQLEIQLMVLLVVYMVVVEEVLMVLLQVDLTMEEMEDKVL
jgi:hypothetical protein